MGTLFAILFTVGWIAIFVFRVEDRSESMPHYAGAERFWVNAAAVILSVHTTLVCFSLTHASISLGRGLLGAALYAFSMGFWLWGRMQIGPIRLTRTPDAPPLEFRRDGAFGVVRHPLYFAMTVYVLALAAVGGAALHWFTAALAWLAIGVRAVQEERRLREQLGAAYEEYARQVPRLVPFVW